MKLHILPGSNGVACAERIAESTVDQDEGFRDRGAREIQSLMPINLRVQRLDKLTKIVRIIPQGRFVEAQVSLLKILDSVTICGPLHSLEYRLHAVDIFFGYVVDDCS